MTASIVVALALLTSGPQARRARARRCHRRSLAAVAGLLARRRRPATVAAPAPACVPAGRRGPHRHAGGRAGAADRDARRRRAVQRTVTQDDCRGTERAQLVVAWPAGLSDRDRDLWARDAAHAVERRVHDRRARPGSTCNRCCRTGRPASASPRFHPAGNQRLADGQPVRPPASGAFDVGRRAVDRGGRARDAARARARRDPGGHRRRRGRFQPESAVADHARRRRVAERVIDLMVGLTYPEHFVIKSGGGSVGGDVRRRRRRSVLRADRRPGRCSMAATRHTPGRPRTTSTIAAR